MYGNIGSKLREIRNNALSGTGTVENFVETIAGCHCVHNLFPSFRVPTHYFSADLFVSSIVGSIGRRAEEFNVALNTD